MMLSVGARLGPYEVVSGLGVGGMGEVYRARDTKLNRDVALKILPEAFAVDGDRIARFRREAQVLASLNHPNIAAIYGFEDSGGTCALVLELVEGPTLADRIAKGPIPLDEASPIAKQIADALEAAHEQGIIHRDLKPANIKLRDDGTVKVLDFGLAKALEPASAISPALTASPTITTPAQMTGVGMILGTAAYMSPEQAKGRPADKRSDIWAFGCVLYEMLTGKRAFDGDDVSDTLAAVLRGQPDWTALPADFPEHLRLLLHRCLEKDRSKRVSDVGIAQFLMTETSLAMGQTRTPPPPRPSWTRLAPIATSAILGAVVVGGAIWQLRLQPTPPIVTRFAYRIPDDQRFTNPGRHVLAISPDGTRIAYVANQLVYLKAMWDADAKPLFTGAARTGVTTPVFSPDGQWVAYWSAPNTLNKVAITGGAPVKLADIDNPFGLSWTGNSLFVGQGAKGIVRVPDRGGAPEVVIRVKKDEIAHGPQLLPDGRSILFTLASGIEQTGQAAWDSAQIVVQAIGSTEPKTIIRGGADARYVETGHIVYAVRGVLLAVPFDARKLETSGGPVPIVEGVARAGGQATGAAQACVSGTGTLAYLAGPAAQTQTGFALGLLDLKGNVEALRLPPRRYVSPRFSPNGRKLAFEIDEGKNANIWVYDLDGRTQPRQLTFGGNNRFPIWTSDSSKITFQSDRNGGRSIFWQQEDGKGPAESLINAAQNEALLPESWSSARNALLFTSRTGDGDFYLRIFTVRDQQNRPFADVRSSTVPHGGFSHDGRWVTYAINSTGNDVGMVYVRPFPLTDEIHTIGPGNNPFWDPKRLSLYFVTNPGVSVFSVANIMTEPVFGVSEPMVIARPAVAGGGPNQPRAYDVAPDGQHFVIATATETVNSIVGGLKSK